MKRRNFIKRLPIIASAPIMLNSIPLSVMAKGSHLARLASTSANDNVLILIQMHGGNDGLNTIIPVDQYANYYNIRPNIAISDNGPRKYIPLDGSLPIENQVGLHPDMESIKELYDRARVNIVQSVSYENANGSHFRSRDVMFMGGGFDDYFDSGWMGRYLDYEYPGYPDAYPSSENPDPLAIEFGSNISLAFHRSNGIPAAMSIPGENFFDIDISQSGLPPASVEDTHYGDELRYILQMEEKTNQYGDRLRDVYAQGGDASVDYPNTYPFNAPKGRQTSSFYQQLKIIAQLLAGGCQTKIFLTKIGGFDTHADQVEANDSSMGGHAALLYFISTAMQAFQSDLATRGLEEKVLTMTLTEFGRRAASNGSYGTDHGDAAPMLIFGKNVNPGVIGSAPDLSNLNYGNLDMQYDYRQVYASVVKDWFEADDGAVQASRFGGEWMDNRLPIISNGVTSTKESFVKDRFHLKDCYPNPVKDITTIGFMVNRESEVLLRIIDIQGREVKRIDGIVRKVGEQSIQVDLSDLRPGTYIYEINSGTFKESKKLIKI